MMEKIAICAIFKDEAPYLLDRQLNRGEPRARVSSSGNVVGADHGQIRGHPQAGPLGRAEDAKRREVVRREYRSRPPLGR